METKNNITTGVIWKNMLIFFFPIFMGSVFQQLYNAVDAIIVGRFIGKEALSAVGGSTFAVVSVWIGFFNGVASGVTVVVAKYFGAGRTKEVSRAVHTALITSLVSGIVLGLVAILCTEQILQWLLTPDDIFLMSRNYLWIYFASAFGCLFYNTGAAILRAIGDSKRPLYFLVFTCVVNIVLDILFVMVFHMGVEGAAVATAIAQILSAVLVFIVLLRSKDCYRFKWSECTVDFKILGRILLVGVPAGLQAVMYGMSNAVVQAKVNFFGTDTIAAWTAYSKLDSLYWTSLSAMGIAATTFVGQNYGAGKMDRVKKCINQSLVMTLMMAISLSAMFYFFADPLFRIFVTDANVHALGVSQMKFLMPFYFLYAFVEVISGGLRGLEKIVIPTIISVVLVCGLRVAWLMVVLPYKNTMEAVMMCYPITWVAAGIAFIIYYLHVLHGMRKRKQLL